MIKLYRRGCFYNSERHLQLFKIYTQHNCIVECMVNYTLTSCGCAPFYYPHTKGVKLCGYEKLKCTRYNYELFRSNVTSADESYLKTKCNCLPACFSVRYEPEIVYSNTTQFQTT